MNWHCCEATAEEETKNYLKIMLQIKTDKKAFMVICILITMRLSSIFPRKVKN